MKNEPIVAYNHLQEEESKESVSRRMHVSHKGGNKDWRMFFNPFAIAIEIAAVLAMAVYMIVELFK